MYQAYTGKCIVTFSCSGIAVFPFSTVLGMTMNYIWQQGLLFEWF